MPKTLTDLLYSAWLGSTLTIFEFGGVQSRPGQLFDRYAVLGDDVLITDQEVARVYKTTLGRLGFEQLSEILDLHHRLSGVR